MTDLAVLDEYAREQIDRVAIQELVQRERTARDMQQWDEFAASYSENSWVDISWFKGTGADFAIASAEMAKRGLSSFHHMSPTVTRIKGDRALADTAVAIHLIAELDGVEVDATSHARLYMRVERAYGRWLITGLRVVYIKDMISPVNPSLKPLIDQAGIAQYRRSYCYISYILAKNGHDPKFDLPGIDRPELVSALLNAEHQWLERGY